MRDFRQRPEREWLRWGSLAISVLVPVVAALVIVHSKQPPTVAEELDRLTPKEAAALAALPKLNLGQVPACEIIFGEGGVTVLLDCALPYPSDAADTAVPLSHHYIEDSGLRGGY